MKTWIITAISIALVLSFTLVWLISPNDDDFMARYTPESYVTVASFEVPLDGSRVVDIVSPLYPFSVKTVKMDIDRLEIRVNRNTSGNLSGFMQENMSARLSFVPEDGTRVNLEIEFPRPIRNFLGDTFRTVKVFDDYNKVLYEHAEIMICVPMNYAFE